MKDEKRTAPIEDEDYVDNRTVLQVVKKHKYSLLVVALVVFALIVISGVT